MRVEAIRLKNFRAFRDVDMRDIPGFCVLVGANGTGKSTLFSVFAFLRDAMTTNVTAALGRLGGSRGLQEVRSRGSKGPIEMELKIRADLGRDKPSLITYSLKLDEDNGRHASRGGQVFVSTHSPDFLNAVEISEVFWLVKENGYTSIRRGIDDPQIVRYMEEGDKLGYLWKQGFFEGADPR